ncbi:GNAT family N-acetyltransferase [Hymenobacter aerilatus]|uniref:GNAT family N-acetyltransferase n=1 Tax=Hymenobacter aerilatus TaxID=2932251 RepID=A0A8T9T032_9BACT|nr:GNAT family N-acetyltransferase [Hymenobacter aerilatus]UOR05456.1 GNAT family N-acetyltransferase [Hymenobacter aerilatus]
MTTLSSMHILPITPEQTYPLRHQVLWPDKPLVYVQLAEDAEGYHFGAFVNEELVSVISLFVNTQGEARFRKFATHPDWQGRGMGTALLTRVVDEATRLGAHTLWCDSRQSAADFYRRFDMQPTGEVFYKGPIPYVRMQRRLP